MDGAGEEKNMNPVRFTRVLTNYDYNEIFKSCGNLLNRFEEREKNRFLAQIQLRKVQMAFKAIDYGTCGVYEYENCESKCLQCEMRRILTST